MKFFYKTRGSISVFLILVLFPMYTCAYLAVDSARISAAKAKITGANRLSGNAALSNYDKTLKKLYGLMAVSSDNEKLESDVYECFSSMIDDFELPIATDSFTQSLIGNLVEKIFQNKYSCKFDDIISTKTVDINVEFPTDASIVISRNMEKSIESNMKYIAPYNFACSLKEKVKIFNQIDAVSNVLNKSKKYYSSFSKALKTMESISEVFDIENDNGVLNKESLEKSLDLLTHLNNELKGSESNFQDCENAINSMEDGETKSLLKSNFSNSAGILSENSIETLKGKIQRDIQEIEEKGTTENPQYSQDALFEYIKNTYAYSDEDKKQKYSEVKSNLDTFTDTGVDDFLPDIANMDISEAISKEVYESIYSLNGDSYDNERDITIGSFGSLGDALDDCYIEEYINSVFNCLTVDQSNSPIPRGETEYVLFGKKNIKDNITLSVDLIFAVRLIMNSIYAFSNPEIRQTALGIAATIAGWSGIGVPVAQNVLLFSLSTAESLLDISTLCKGGSVPVYKNSSSWTLSFSGMVGKLSQSAKGMVCATIDDVFERINSIRDESITKAEDILLNYTNQVSHGIAESLAGMIVTPVENKVRAIINTNIGARSKDEIRELILDSVEHVSTSKGYLLALSMFEKYCLDEIVNVIYDNYSNLNELGCEKVENVLLDVYRKILGEIFLYLGGYSDEIKKKLSTSISDTATSLKKKSVEIIENYTEEITDLMMDDISGEKSSISVYSGVCMSYREYLKLFTLFKLTSDSGKNHLLQRTAEIIQINCQKENPGYNICNCYTAIKIFSEVNVGVRAIHSEEKYEY